MPYLICNECEIYYEIDSYFDSELKLCEKCGKNLKYYANFDEYYQENDSNVEQENADFNNFHIENKNYNYDKTAFAGLILAIVGLSLFTLAYVWPFLFISENFQNFENPDNIWDLSVEIILIYVTSILLMATGVLSYMYSKRKSNNQEIDSREKKRSIKKRNVYKITAKEKPTVDYFKKLPEGYFILNNLKILSRKINISHIIIGPTGIFLIHIKNLKGHYIINDNEWLNDKGKMTGNRLGNPSQQVKLNAIELKRFLDSKNLNIDYMLINSIVAFPNNNFTVRKMPRTYNILRVEEVSNFIVNSKTKMDMGTVTGAVLLLEPYCSEVTRS